MQNPRTIDSGSHDFAEALTEAEAARQDALASVEFLQLARFYSEERHGLDPLEAEVRVGLMLASSHRALVHERESLHRLNAVLLHAGGSAGDVYLVGRGLYRVCNAGRLAVYLGQSLPGYDEIVAAFEPMEATDERDEDMASFAEMVHIPH